MQQIITHHCFFPCICKQYYAFGDIASLKPYLRIKLYAICARPLANIYRKLKKIKKKFWSFVHVQIFSWKIGSIKLDAHDNDTIKKNNN